MNALVLSAGKVASQAVQAVRVRPSVSITAILAIAGVIVTGLLTGHNSVLAGAGLAVIGGIAGYAAGRGRYL